MKTIPLFVSAAVCCTAHAQSSVTIYGVVDAAMSRGIGSVSRLDSMTSGGNTASRLGFRGTEDLGGGQWAGFTLESGLNNDSGEGVASNSNNQTSGAGASGPLTFNRRSTVSLGGGWGELRIGRDFTSQYRNRLEADPFASGGVGAIQPYTGSIAGPVSTRASNMLTYFLPPNIGGLYGQTQVYFGETQSTAPDAGTGANFRLGYVWNRLNVSLAAARTRYPRDATTGDIDTQNLAVHYEWNALKVSAALFRDVVYRVVPLKANGTSLAGIWKVGPGEVKVALSSYGTNAAGQPDTRKVSLGYVHNLSKRTALYATYAHLANSGGASAALNGSSTARNASSQGFDLGIRHLF
jgi:predicted porin